MFNELKVTRILCIQPLNRFIKKKVNYYYYCNNTLFVIILDTYINFFGQKVFRVNQNDSFWQGTQPARPDHFFTLVIEIFTLPWQIDVLLFFVVFLPMLVDYIISNMF